MLAPNLTILPPPQLQFWSELDETPEFFTLYGGTGLALHLGHRTSVDFDFFSSHSFDPEGLAVQIPYLRVAERVQVAPNTLKCRIDRGGPVLVSFFGGLSLGQVAPREEVEGKRLFVASLLDLAGTKVAVVQRRAEVKDYVDIDALLQHGVDLPTALAAGQIVYGVSFNPVLALKALSFFGDVPAVPVQVQHRLRLAVEAVDPNNLPVLRSCVELIEEGGWTP